MSLDETQSTAVSGDSPAAVSESTDTLAPAVEQSGEQAQERSGDVTAQPASEGNVVEEGVSTPPPAEEDDPLKDVPTQAELEQQVSQKVPYAQALLKLRTALEARNSEVSELRGKTSTAEPVLPLIEQYGGAETVKSRLETFDSLFTPVVNPTTQQPEVDPATGFPRITATPFIERVDGENPGMAEQLLFDALQYKADFGGGQKVALYQHPAVQAELLRACGLDPQRADDYRNIDALVRPQDTGEITPEELAEIPEAYRDTFKSLPPGIRADLKLQDEQTRQFNLEVYKERADRKLAETQAAQAQAQERQAAEQQARQYVAQEQDSFVTQQIQEGYAQVMDDLASKVTFSDDAGTNAVMHGMVGSYLLALRDPDSRFITEKTLEHLGVKVEPSFYESLSVADQHYREAKAYELFGQKGLQQKALAEASRAKTQVIAKLSTIAVKAAKALGSQMAGRAEKSGQSLTDATRTRPVPTDGSGTTEQNGLLPPGMRADSPEAGLYLWKKIQAQYGA